MTVTIIVGTQWGDEGKGKITDFYASKAEVIARFQGGNNAGHTIVVGDEVFKLHVTPSGVIQGDKTVVIGNGVVLDLYQLKKELDELKDRGIPVDCLFISDRVHLILPYHRKMDGLQERLRTEGTKIGTTGRGIGPAYSDKTARTGIRAGDLLEPDHLRERIKDSLVQKNILFEAAGEPIFDADQITDELLELAGPMIPRIADTSALLNDAIRQGQSVLLEGAQGSYLDIDHGTYPFVTSSNTVAGGACAGAGIGPGVIDEVVGIVKAYTTRVGEGPFVTELTDEIGERIQEKGHEFGTTTERPRRCGWLDMVMLRRSRDINGLTSFAVTKIDVLDGIDKLKVCTAYELDGKELTMFPSSLEKLGRCKPVYQEFDGWPEMSKDDYTKVKEVGMDALPENLVKYVDFMAEDLGIPYHIVSFGPGRDETVDLRPDRG